MHMFHYRVILTPPGAILATPLRIRPASQAVLLPSCRLEVQPPEWRVSEQESRAILPRQMNEVFRRDVQKGQEVEGEVRNKRCGSGVERDVVHDNLDDYR